MTGNAAPQHWADVLRLRDEVRQTDGSVGELQMSLAKAVYQTVLVPYANCEYFTDITQPTPLLVGFLGRVARRIGVTGMDAQACFHLDQGMGGGKSHALVGLWHMINTPEAFFATELGQAVGKEAAAGGHTIGLDGVVPVVLIGDSMSPGRTDPRFGPATDLFGRFLWLLFDGRPDRMARYQHFTNLGANKATLQAAFAEVDRPILVIIDELMDYAMALTDQSAIGGMPGEQGFLNALTDAVDDQPQVALVVVMIRSDEDDAGYVPAAEEMREYLAARLQRNGETVTVTEPADFAQIIRRRLFARADVDVPARATATAYVAAADEAWSKEVYAKLGTGRTLGSLPDRVADTYPFHPDLFELVSKEWSVVQAFQRVRSTVSIFARTVLHWVSEHEAGRWAPQLIGTGDIPLQTDALEALLSSGVLAGNDRAIQGFRAVANTDIISAGGGKGTAVALDKRLVGDGLDVAQPQPAVRMASANFAYSLVPRSQGARGATKPEMLSSLAGPGVPYAAAEEVFNALTASPVDGGLGALERTAPVTARGMERFHLSIKQTLNMFHATALTMISDDMSLERVWQRAQLLASKGTFGGLAFVDAPDKGASTSTAALFAGVDSQENRLVVLDPRRWTLLNGKDAATRADLDLVFGVQPGMTSAYAASMVAALVNTQRRAKARDRARDVMAWEGVVAQLGTDSDEYGNANARLDEARSRFDQDVRWAYQHYAYLLRTSTGLTVQYRPVPDGKTSLNGADVWTELVSANRAVATDSLAAAYVGQLIATGNFGRDLTPKEIFSLPFSNPNWPLVARIDDLRKAVFELATGPEWMLVDSDGTEIRPERADQIQVSTMQQVLQARVLTPVAAPTATTTPPTSGAPGFAPPSETPGGPTQIVPQPGTPGAPSVTPSVATYEITRVKLPLSSVTDLAKRDATWHLIREVASLLDSGKPTDVQMVGIEVTITARTGEAAALQEKARSLPGVMVTIEEDDF